MKTARFEISTPLVPDPVSGHGLPRLCRSLRDPQLALLMMPRVKMNAGPADDVSLLQSACVASIASNRCRSAS